MIRILTNILANMVAVLVMPGVLIIIGTIYLVELITGEHHE